MGFFLLENEKCWELPETDYGKKFGSKRNKSLFLNCSFTMISQLLDLGRLVVYLYYKKIFFRRKKDLLNNFTHVDQGYIKALFYNIIFVFFFFGTKWLFDIFRRSKKVPANKLFVLWQTLLLPRKPYVCIPIQSLYIFIPNKLFVLWHILLSTVVNCWISNIYTKAICYRKSHVVHLLT